MRLPVDLQKNEVVVALLRRHPVYVIIRASLVGITTLVVFAFFLWFGVLDGGKSSLLLTLGGIALILGVGYLAIILYRYWNDVWLITNQRLVDSTKPTPFNHLVSSTDLVNIQDLSVSKQGMFATMFNFGDVHCHTASNTMAFSFRAVPNPNQVLDIIDKYRDDARMRVMQGGGV